MGADLYINSTFKPNHEKYRQQFDDSVTKCDAAETKAEKKRYQGKVEQYYGKMFATGYFRDSYNNSKLLWKLGLDYWVWFREFLDEEGRLHPDKAEAVLAEIEHRKHHLDEIEEKQEQEYFREKYEEFVGFLRTAIELDEPIECSI